MLIADWTIDNQSTLTNQHSAILEEVLSHTTEARAGTTGRG
jgi:hypothetical protein